MREPPRELMLMVKDIAAGARAALAEEGQLAGMMIVGGWQPQRWAKSVPFAIAPNKDALAFMARLLARTAAAEFVVVISEMWMLDEQHAGEGEAILKRNGGTLKDAPEAIDGVMFSIETHDGQWVASAAQIVKGGKKTFGELKFEMLDMEGRFVGLLPPKGKAS